MADKVKTYGWVASNREPLGTQIDCVKSPDDTQYYANLVSPVHPTPFHDELLMNATAEINKILAPLHRKAEQSNLELALLAVPDGLFLAYTGSGVGAESSDEEIAHVLGLSRAKQ